MYIKINVLLFTQAIIFASQAMHSPISANSANEQRQIISTQNTRNQHHNLVIIVKQLANIHKVDLKELSVECHHFKKINGRLPAISEAVQIAANLKKQYIRQDEISQTIMSHIFVDQDNLQSPSLEGYQHAESIMDHLGI
jgi:hypothetical protein